MPRTVLSKNGADRCSVFKVNCVAAELEVPFYGPHGDW